MNLASAVCKVCTCVDVCHGKLSVLLNVNEPQELILSNIFYADLIVFFLLVIVSV